jgi:hypothetical protein
MYNERRLHVSLFLLQHPLAFSIVPSEGSSVPGSLLLDPPLLRIADCVDLRE